LIIQLNYSIKRKTEGGIKLNLSTMGASVLFFKVFLKPKMCSRRVLGLGMARTKRGNIIENRNSVVNENLQLPPPSAAAPPPAPDML
jgi:hypothetical protein